MQSRAQHDKEVDISSKGYRLPIVEVNLIAESPAESPEVSVNGGEKSQSQL